MSAPLSRDELVATARAIARLQQSDGRLPWFARGRVDPWDMVEALMGLDVTGFHDEAVAGYRWLASRQRIDGAWAAAYMDDAIEDPTLDANFSSYIATGVWLHYLATENLSFLDAMWPVVESAIGFALDLQTPGGEILWARDAGYRPWPRALLTSSSCTHLSLRCALAVAHELGCERPDWELSLARLTTAVARADDFEDKDRFSMDWYYPVLGGAIHGEDARDRLLERWAEFVIEARGVRCVSDRPWVTAGESAEMVIALCAAGMDDRARALFEWLGHLRDGSGLYWTGATWPDGVIWPREQTSWSAGAVLLAADALAGDSPTSDLFRGEGLPVAVPVLESVPDAL